MWTAPPPFRVKLPSGAWADIDIVLTNAALEAERAAPPLVRVFARLTSVIRVWSLDVPISPLTVASLESADFDVLLAVTLELHGRIAPTDRELVEHAGLDLEEAVDTRDTEAHLSSLHALIDLAPRALPLAEIADRHLRVRQDHAHGLVVDLPPEWPALAAALLRLRAAAVLGNVSTEGATAW